MKRAAMLAEALPVTLGKVEAVRLLATRAGFPDMHADAEGSGVPTTLLAIQRVMGKLRNLHLQLRLSSDIAGASHRVVAGRHVRELPPPDHRSGMPECFTAQSPVAITPEYRLLHVPNGHLCHVPDVPLVVGAGGEVIAADYSSRYAGLVHCYDFDMRQMLADALEIDGTVIVMADEVRPLNFSHWLADWLPRLACLGERVLDHDVRVLVPPLNAEYQWETLRLCGFPRSRVIELGPMQAVRARELLVPSDLNDTPHPGHKAAPWLLHYLRGTLGYGAFLDGLNGPPLRGKLYVSRNDTGGRRVLNEEALTTVLARAGYQTIRLSGMDIAQQIAQFATATHIVAPHGAGLANVVFAAAGTTLVELFPATYGTAAFYVLAAGTGLRYASYVARKVVSGSRTQLDDMEIDIDDFLARCGVLL